MFFLFSLPFSAAIVSNSIAMLVIAGGRSSFYLTFYLSSENEVVALTKSRGGGPVFK